MFAFLKTIKTLEFENKQLRMDIETLATQFDALRERSDKLEKQNKALHERQDTLSMQIIETLDSKLEDEWSEAIESAIERKVSRADLSISFRCW